MRYIYIYLFHVPDSSIRYNRGRGEDGERRRGRGAAAPPRLGPESQYQRQVGPELCLAPLLTLALACRRFHQDLHTVARTMDDLFERSRTSASSAATPPGPAPGSLAAHLASTASSGGSSVMTSPTTWQVLLSSIIHKLSF